MGCLRTTKVIERSRIDGRVVFGPTYALILFAEVVAVNLCKIIPKTQRLRQVVKEFGVEWVAISEAQKVQCFDGALGVHIKSKCGRHSRWVRYPSQIIML